MSKGLGYYKQDHKEYSGVNIGGHSHNRSVSSKHIVNYKKVIDSEEIIFQIYDELKKKADEIGVKIFDELYIDDLKNYLRKSMDISRESFE